MHYDNYYSRLWFRSPVGTSFLDRFNKTANKQLGSILNHVLERIKDQPRRILDEASRRRRQRKALEALEADNFQDDPHADLKLNRKAPKFDLDFDEGCII